MKKWQKYKYILFCFLGAALLIYSSYGRTLIKPSEQKSDTRTVEKKNKTDNRVDAENQNTCTMLIECSTILEHKQKLKAGSEKLVPKDGIIYRKKEVTFKKGDSVFDILLREVKKNKIHMEYSDNAAYKSSYIEGINNLYEFDCGELSGWMYCVNGKYPNYGCNRYIIKRGDQIEWHYTCDLGRDLKAGIK